MKSGRGFHESCNDVFVKAYRRDLMRSKKLMTEEEADGELPPYLWEYKKSPWFLALAVKIFRRDPQLAPDVSDVMLDKENIPVSRAALLRIKQEKAAAAVLVKGRRNRNGYQNGGSEAGADVGSVVHIAEAIKNKRKAAWAKVQTARAMAMQSKISQRLGRFSELEKAMDLLDRMRTVIGEVQYRAKVATVAASFPEDFATFNSDVDVLVIDSSDDDKDDNDKDDDNFSKRN